MSHLIVYLNSEKIGVLREESGLMYFSYDSQWLETPSNIPLSRSLPLQKEEFDINKTRAFFAGILPEERPRQIISKILGISNSNDFAMLEKIGWECAGAVSLLPESLSPSDLSLTSPYTMTESELEEIIIELPRRPLMVGKEGIRLSLAGAQNKLPVIFDGDVISLPQGNTPSTHILKPEPENFPGLAVNELFCMKLAESIGLNVSHTEFLKIGKKECILVRRYDRNTGIDGKTVRLHQEDFCQALGFPPEKKYQTEGGPTLNDCILLLRDWSTAPVIDIPAFLNVLIFNVLIGNADAHGKNFSFLYSYKQRKLAPFYDLVSTLSWPELTKNLAMKIGGNQTVNAFTIGNWRKMAKKTGVSWPMLRERIAENCKEILNKLPEIEEKIQKYNSSMTKELNKTISGQIKKMLDALAKQKV